MRRFGFWRGLLLRRNLMLLWRRLMLLRSGLMLLRSSLMLRGCRFRRAFIVCRSRLTFWPCSRSRLRSSYGFDLWTGRLRFYGRLSRTCRVVRRRRRGSVFGFCRWLCSRSVLGRLVLIRARCRSVVVFRLVRRCTTRSRVVFCSFVLASLARSGSVFGGLRLSRPVLGRLRLGCLIRFSLVLSRFALSRAVLSSLILSGLVFSRLRLGRLARFRLVLRCLRLGRSVCCWSSARRYYVLTGKFSRLGCRRDCRTPVIHRREHFTIPTRRLSVACLRFGRRSVQCMIKGILRASGPRVDAAVSAVVADVA